MAALKTPYCVEIRVPKKNSSGFGFGSGYTLGPCWVFTSCHVLFRDGFDESKPVQITWWDRSGEKKEGGSPFPVERKNIVWFNKKHDIALIRCDVLSCKNAPTAWTELAEDRPRSGAVCRCGGYLANLHNTKGGPRRKTPQGEFGLFDQDIAADIDKLSGLDDDELWAGFSGSPVYSDNKLTAVVQWVNTGERGKGLRATFIAPALDAVGDNNLIPLRQVEDFLVSPGTEYCWNLHRKYVVQELNRDSTAFETLKQGYREKISAADEIRLQEQFAQALYHNLQTQDRQSKIIHCFTSVFGKMRGDQDVKGVRLLMRLSRILLALLTAEQRDVSDISAYKNNPYAPPFSVKAEDPVQAEVEGQAANSEERRPEFELNGEQFSSVFDITPGHNTGMDSNYHQMKKDIVRTHYLKTVPGKISVDKLKDTVESFATRSRTGIPIDQLPKDNIERGSYCGNQLDRACRAMTGSHYIILDKARNEEGRKGLDILREWCPQLVLFEVESVYDRDRTMNLSELFQIILEAEEFLRDYNEEENR